MLQITIPKIELFDEAKEEFISIKEQTLQLEHSLVSISKWESKWNKAFLNRKDLTSEETIDYIRCMTLNKNIDPICYNFLSNSDIQSINDYISAPMTAVYFLDEPNNKKSNDVVTSEVIYYWMIALNIPFECQKWHLNRLLSLIRVCEVKNRPKKRSGKEIMAQNQAINMARRKQLNSKG